MHKSRKKDFKRRKQILFLEVGGVQNWGKTGERRGAGGSRLLAASAMASRTSAACSELTVT